MLKKLLKLRGKSVAEIKDRAHQQFSMFAERAGLASDAKMMSDAELFERFETDNQNLTPAKLLEHFRTRSTNNFYASMHDPEVTLAELRRVFPHEERAIIGRADRIVRGSFDLLGYRDLRFRSDVPDWHFDPVSGKTPPLTHWSAIDELSSELSGDKKVIWELNRHQYFSVLGRAYWLTGDEKYAQAWASHIDDWIVHNQPKMGVNWLSSLEISFRSISWIWSLYFFRNSAQLNDERLVRILKILYLNARHLETYLSTYFSPNTHLTGEAVGLFFLGSFLPGFAEATRWKETGYKILLDALDFQVRSDGTYVEQSSHYHRYTTDFYANLFILLKVGGSIPEAKLREKLEKLLEFLLYIQQPNGETPLFGDDDGGRFYFFDERPINDFRPTLALGAVLLDRGDFKFAAGEPSPELLWLLGPAGVQTFQLIEPTDPPTLSRHFEDGGFLTVRNSWQNNADQMIVQCGPHGFLNGGHAHADALNFIITVGGRPIFVDSGTFNYTADRTARDRYRSSQAHNCLTVNGQSSSIADGPFSWLASTDSRFCEFRESDSEPSFCGTHDGFRALGVEYERKFHFAKSGSVRIIDTVINSRKNLFEVHFVLCPGLDATVDMSGQRVSVIDEAKNELLAVETQLAGDQSKFGTWSVEDWSVSLSYGAESASRKMVFRIEASGDLEIKTDLMKPVA